MRISLNVKGAGVLEALLEDITGPQLSSAIVGSLNKAATAGRTRLTKRISAELNLKSLNGETPGKYIKRNIKTTKANKGQFATRLRIRKRATTAPRFMTPAKLKVGAFRNKPGVSFKPFKNGPAKTVRGSFVFRSPINGQLLVGYRDPESTLKLRSRGRVERGIKTVYGPSLFQVAKQKGTLDDVQQRMNEVFRSEYGRRLERTLAKASARKSNRNV